MTTFSIDDVRETFTTDVTTLLVRIEEGAHVLLGPTGLVEPGSRLPDGRPIFEMLADAGHAIGGTTSLVGAHSLTESARALEDLARGGQETLLQLEQSLARVRETARLCLEGVGRMRAMLEMELGDRSSEALRESLSWLDSISNRKDGPDRKTLGERRPGPAAAEAGSADLPSTFSFEEAPVPAPEDISQFAFDEDPPAPSMGLELREVFEEEAQEILVALHQDLQALTAEPGNTRIAGNLERLFHTLKGAAATVGLDEVSQSAARLQVTVEELAESGAPATPEFLRSLLTDIDQMLQLAALPVLNLEGTASLSEPGTAGDAARTTHQPASTVEQARGFFLEEARQLVLDASSLAASLGGGDPEAAQRSQADLAAMFHRLKGSALIVGERGISEQAERLQLLFERREGEPDFVELARQLKAGLEVVSAELVRPPVADGSEPDQSPEPQQLVAARPVRRSVQLEVNPELWEAFLQECKDLLEATDKELLALEESEQPKQALESLMRLCHTLKGVVNTVGLTPTGEMLHLVEDLLETLMAAAILPPMRALATFLLGVQGDVRRHLRQARDGYVETDLGRLEARIARLLGRPRARGALNEQSGGVSLTGLTGEHPGGPTEAGASIHSIHSARSLRSARDQGRSSAPASQDDDLDRRYIRVATDRLDALMNLAGELVVSRSRLLTRVSALRGLQQGLGFGSRRLLQTIEDFREEHEFGNLGGRRRRAAASARPAPVRAAPARTAAQGSGQPGRSEWENFSELELDQYEDIHILSRRMTEMTGDFNEVAAEMARNLAAFNDDSDVFGRIVSGIQGEITRARMVPLEQLFTRLRLPVRDAAARDAKEVRVVVEGADVHIDKTIADALMQPMLHLVRNAVVHGVEGSATREKLGKPPTGTITLRARQESGQIVVEVRDDGAGLDLERLRARGVAMGLIAADTPLSDPTIRDLVFAPGLSTRARAGAVSGRGVGCDVVRRSVERLNGTIRVESTQARGTTFVVTLPVTLAITKALIVRHGERNYAIPLHFAERIIDAEEEGLIHSAGVHRIKVGGSFLTVGRLDQHFGTTATPSTSGPVLMLRVGAARAALQVDAVIGQEEVVVKSLGDILTGHPLFAGVTIRGSGELVLIVDVPGLVDKRRDTGLEGRDRTADRRPGSPRRPPPDKITSDASAEAGGELHSTSAGELSSQGGPLALPPVAAPSGPLRVLFIDDSLSVRKFAQMTLQALGVEVTLAVDGLDGMAKLREGSFDLVFTDLEMPRMHGFELIRELRFLPLYHDLPIVVVTSRSGQKHQQQARALGATEYLTKPFTAQSLGVVLERWGRQRAPLELAAHTPASSASSASTPVSSQDATGSSATPELAGASATERKPS